MPPPSTRPALVLEPDVAVRLATLSASRTAPARDVERATMMLDYARGKRISEIARTLAVSRDSVEDCLDRAEEGGPLAALRDRPGRGRAAIARLTISAWVFGLFAIVVALHASGRRNPTSMAWDGHAFAIEYRESGEQVDIVATDVATGVAGWTFTGTTDEMCDPPVLYQVDFDGDGVDDLYGSACGGAGYARFDPTTGGLVYTDVADDDNGARPRWFALVREDGVSVGLVGAALVAVALAGTCIVAWMSRMPAAGQ